MIDKTNTVKVINKFNGVVGYEVPELGVKRTFQPKESKDIAVDELEQLSFIPGGDVILKEYLEITDENVVLDLFNTPSEPEYHYTEADIKEIMTSGSLDQFLDCLDFAPDGIKDTIKTLAVELELNDMNKRQAIQDKLGFNVSRAIEIKNTKYDGETEVTEKKSPQERRTAPIKAKEAAPARRVIKAKPAATMEVKAILKEEKE